MQLTIDASDLTRTAELYALMGAKAGTVIARAINYTGARAHTAVARSISRSIGLPVRQVQGALKERKANSRDLLFQLTSRGHALPLRLFHPHQTTEGVQAKVWGQVTVFPHAFIVQSLHDNVFKRALGGGGRFGLVARLPIEKLTGPSIPQAMVEETAVRAFEDAVNQYLSARIVHELEFMMARTSAY